MDSIFPITFNNPDPPTFAPEGINPNPMTFLGNDSLLGNTNSPPGDLTWSNSDHLELDNNLIANWLASELDNPPIEDMENPQTEAPMIAADSMVTGVVWPGESSSSKQHKFAVAVDQVLPLLDLTSSSSVGHGFPMSQSDEAYGGTLRSSRDNSDKSDDNEIEG
uniref:Uncharacterized protein n=1 Tax=Fagus sylvatica TaxID=28930 RepID=A0A2N9G882_FAGSY